MNKLLFVVITGLIFAACTKKEESAVFYNPILDSGQNPSACFVDDFYYYTQETSSGIRIWKTKDITNLRNAISKDIEIPSPSNYKNNIWGIEIVKIFGKWYIYYAADNGSSDNHQIFVLECVGNDPMNDEFVQKGPIITNSDWNWALHASPFIYKDELYLIWSGWPQRRITEENQCIYIAKMENPWTLASNRIKICSPELEWERQWINPDGGRTAYPIYVNESPQFLLGKDEKTAYIFYSASGCWTPYYCIGMLSNDSGDLLNPSAWKKCKEPVFSLNAEENVWGPGSPSFIPSPDYTETYIIYTARSVPNSNTRYEETSSPSPRIQKIEWSESGMPILGTPKGLNTPLKKPSGTIIN